MGRYTVSLEEYLDHILRKAHVHFTFDVLVRYGVVVVVCADMVVILYGGYFPGRKFIWVRRQRQQEYLFFGECRCPAALFLLKGFVVQFNELFSYRLIQFMEGEKLDVTQRCKYPC